MTIKEIRSIISDKYIMEQLSRMQNINDCINSHSFTVYEEKTAKKELKEMAKEIIANIK